MKIRLDYVTNSSSSSYLIAYRKPGDEYHSAVLDLFLDADSDYDSARATRIHSIQELDKFLLNDMSWSGCKTVDDLLKYDESLRPTYDKAKAALQDGYTVAFKDISYNNETLIAFAVFLEMQGDITILDRENE